MSGGYGIAGHKNSFRSGVRLGNWVEERFGSELLQQRGPAVAEYVSETKQRFRRPTAAETAASGSLDAEAALAREGLPSHLLFGHGAQEPVDPHAHSGNRYVSMNQIAAATGAKAPTRAEQIAGGATRGAQRDAAIAAFAPAKTEMGRSKARSDEAERTDDLYRSVTAVDMADVPRAPSQRVAPARSHGGFTRSFRQGIPGLRR